MCAQQNTPYMKSEINLTYYLRQKIGLKCIPNCAKLGLPSFNYSPGSRRAREHLNLDLNVCAIKEISQTLVKFN